MSSYFCITVRFLQPLYHGRSDDAGPEWPPSPLRLFQALVAGSAARWNERKRLAHAVPALQWLEKQPAPEIVAPTGQQSLSGYRIYVPDNTGDNVARSWVRGGAASIADYRTEKDVRSMHLNGDAVHYLYPVDNADETFAASRDLLSSAARSITHLGWGIDAVAAQAELISRSAAMLIIGEHWLPVADGYGDTLRAPTEGTLQALMECHEGFLNRITKHANGKESFSPVARLSKFRVAGYRRRADPVNRPYAAFELRTDEGTRFDYAQARFIHIAGMVRHLAIKLMSLSPPKDVENPADWVDSYVAGHCSQQSKQHRQFSYLPLPSIGMAHSDQAVRRIIVSAPLGDDALLLHLAKVLAGQKLKPTPETKISHPPTLVRLQRDGVTRRYLDAATSWASVTPVILPGHNDHKPEKTRKLIHKALAQTGIQQPCEFEWSPFSYFPKSLSAHKYDRDKRPSGYIRPDHLLSETAIHLKLHFDKEVKVPGPLAIGAGRHCGFGLMAGIETDNSSGKGSFAPLV